MKLFLIRHGETENNKYNGMTDVALSQKGQRQAELIGKRLEKEPIKKIYCSNLSRAVETAKKINLAHGAGLKIEAGLSEVNFGLWEGLSFSQISVRYKKELEKWMEEKTAFRFPKGETFEELKERVGKVLARIKREEKSEGVALVAHGGPIKIILCEVLTLGLSNFWNINIDRGSISVVSLKKESQVVLLMNDTCHLGGG